MKLRGQVADVGVRLLERELLPLLEKFGKTCIVLFRPEDVHFIQKAVDADGMQVTARCTQELFFEEGGYNIQSRYKNFIAFGFDISLLRRVLSAACRNSAESLEMKLTVRHVPSGGSAPDQSRPFLCFSTLASNMSIVQDLPITKPLPPSQVDRLVRDLESEVCPFYLDLQPEMQGLQALVDRVKPLGGGLVFATTKGGSTHVQMVGQQVQLGAEFRDLAVLPASAKSAAAESMGHTAEERLKEAIRLGDATEVSVQLKHFQKCLNSSGLMQTQQLWCGISAQRTYVHMLFTFSPLQRGPNEQEGLELSYKMPVWED